MMQDKDFLRKMQRYVANIAISGSALRNQGAAGVTEVARKYLANLDLGVLRGIDNSKYPNQLDKWTKELKQELPDGANNWGTARKAINVFMVQVFLNKYLSKEYGLQEFADALETPLDAQATAKLRKFAGRGKLPEWKSIKKLTAEPNAKYQKVASELAKEKNLSRAYLDMILWRAGQ